MFTIREPKPRVICALPFRDRVVQHALVESMLPSIDRELRTHTFACRRGLGTHRALHLAAHYARLSRFVLVIDLRKFFPSVDHELLRRRLLRHTRTRLGRWLVRSVLSTREGVEPVSFHFPGDDLLAPLMRPHGLPIGNLTSQVWANVHAAPIDHALASRLGLRRWVRYADDVWVFSNDRGELGRAWTELELTATRQRLRLHLGKTHVQPTSTPFRCLGFSIRRREAAVAIRLRGESLRRFKRRAHRLLRSVERGAVSRDDLRRSMLAWLAHARHGHTASLRRRELELLGRWV